MKIRSIVAAAALSLIAGVGSVSADEISVTASQPTLPRSFDLLHDIAAARMTVQELNAIRGNAIPAGQVILDMLPLSDNTFNRNTSAVFR